MSAGVVALIAVAALVAGLAWRRRTASLALADQADAMAEFSSVGPTLTPMFLAAANASGRPRGLRWTGCELSEPTVFALDRRGGELTALASATVSFEAVAGGDMESVEAVGNLRAATAVFVRRQGKWTTDGRAVFNLGPAEALARFPAELAPIG